MKLKAFYTWVLVSVLPRELVSLSPSRRILFVYKGCHHTVLICAAEGRVNVCKCVCCGVVFLSHYRGASYSESPSFKHGVPPSLLVLWCTKCPEEGASQLFVNHQNRKGQQSNAAQGIFFSLFFFSGRTHFPVSLFPTSGRQGCIPSSHSTAHLNYCSRLKNNGESITLLCSLINSGKCTV